MNERTYTADDVRLVRKERECGIDEAKHILDAEQLDEIARYPYAQLPYGGQSTDSLIRRVVAAKDLHDIKIVLVDVIKASR